MAARRLMVVANWKMNGDLNLVQTMSAQLSEVQTPNEILICPPVIFLHSFPSSTSFKLGAQNVSSEKAGPFTGEVSADMLRAAGAKYVIIGHSERRCLFGETDDIVAKKANAAIACGLTPILCFGETLEERQQQKTEQVLAKHLDAVYSAQPDLLDQTVIGYEPYWAIGTGLTASPEQAQEVHAFIRQHIAKINREAAQTIRIIYGGSVNADNCQALFSQPDIDGGLVGGASLKPAEFASICMTAKDV